MSNTHAVRQLIRVGAAGPLLFCAIATVAGLLPPGYDPRHQTISEAALGPFGWLQTLNFYLFGATIAAFAIGFARSAVGHSRVALALFVLAALGVAANGVFPTDLAGAPQTDTGQVHNLLGLGVFLAMILSYPFSAWSMRRTPGWGGHALYTALTAPVAFVLLFVFIGFSSDPGDPLYAISGLVQRAFVLVSFGWMTLTGWRLLGLSNRQHAGSHELATSSSGSY
jgi:hypothetical membrane protein